MIDVKDLYDLMLSAVPETHRKRAALTILLEPDYLVMEWTIPGFEVRVTDAEYAHSRKRVSGAKHPRKQRRELTYHYQIAWEELDRHYFPQAWLFGLMENSINPDIRTALLKDMENK